MDEKCKVTGLTVGEKNAVSDSWQIIKKDWKKVGCDFFIKLFETYPKIKGYFKAFDGLELEQIKDTPKLRAHVINFGSGLSSFVEHMDEPEVLVELIKKLTANHFRRSIGVERFQEAFDLFVKFAKEYANLDEFTVAAWESTLKVVSGVIGEHMKTLKDNNAKGE